MRVPGERIGMSNVIVVGCGRVGSQLANMLSDNGNNVCVIDKNVNAFANLGRNFNGYVCGTSLVAEDVFSKVVSGHGAHLDTFGEFEVLRFSLDLSSTDKRTIRVGELERDHDVRIIAFERSDGSASSIPTRDSILYNGDSVLACVRHELIESFSRYIQD